MSTCRFRQRWVKVAGDNCHCQTEGTQVGPESAQRSPGVLEDAELLAFYGRNKRQQAQKIRLGLPLLATFRTSCGPTCRASNVTVHLVGKSSGGKSRASDTRRSATRLRSRSERPTMMRRPVSWRPSYLRASAGLEVAQDRVQRVQPVADGRQCFVQPLLRIGGSLPQSGRQLRHLLVRRSPRRGRLVQQGRQARIRSP